MMRFRTTSRHDGVRRFRLRRFLHRPAVAAMRTCEYAGIGDRGQTPVAKSDGNLYFQEYTPDMHVEYWTFEYDANAMEKIEQESIQ